MNTFGSLERDGPTSGRRLVIDCATESCSVALFADGALLAGECRQLGRGHAEALVPMIAALPGRGRADVIAVDIGPGSFTGIRVGLAAARALALAWRARVEGFSSLALIAAMARDHAAGTCIDVVTTGGHGEWFFQPFDAMARPLAPLASLAPAAVLARAHAPCVAGSQATAASLGRRVCALPLWPDARAFGLLNPALDVVAAHPTYGRPPDARLPASAA